MRRITPMPVTIHAPAKINLYLHITGKRPDGYHLLESLIAFTNIHDTITISPASQYTLDIKGSFAGTLAGESDNIILKAVTLLSDWVGIKPNIHIALQKEIPIGAGLGGGSSDAAAMLHGLIQYWGVDIDQCKLMEMGLALGADVPVLLKGKASFVSGVGEYLNEVEKPFSLNAVLVNPGIHLSTPHVFKQRAGEFTPKDPHAVAAFRSLPILDFLAVRHNDLESPAICVQPVIRNVLDVLANAPGCKISRMSGSGSTCFGIFDNQKSAEHAADILKDAQPGWWVRTTEIG